MSLPTNEGNEMSEAHGQTRKKDAADSGNKPASGSGPKEEKPLPGEVRRKHRSPKRQPKVVRSQLP
jgi:hypothetical protein